jgi:hypothetical protein
VVQVAQYKHMTITRFCCIALKDCMHLLKAVRPVVMLQVRRENN